MLGIPKVMALWEAPTTYILRGLCRRCCIPEVIVRFMQVSVSLMESGNAHEKHDELIELVASSETRLLHLFSQNQLQEFLLFEREYCTWKMSCLRKLQCGENSDETSMPEKGKKLLQATSGSAQTDRYAKAKIEDPTQLLPKPLLKVNMDPSSGELYYWKFFASRTI